LQKKLARTEHVLIVKVYFKRRKIAKVFITHVQDLFRKSLLKENFLVYHYLYVGKTKGKALRIGISTVQDSPGQFRNWPIVFSLHGKARFAQKFSWAKYFAKTTQKDAF